MSPTAVAIDGVRVVEPIRWRPCLFPLQPPNTHVMELYSFHLFAGAGGGILADLLLGRRTIGAIEIEEFPRSVLLSRMFDGSLPHFPIWDDVRTFRQDNPATAEYIGILQSVADRLVIAGGFPCQDISVAGTGRGLDGDRSGLWFEFERIVRMVRPRYVFVENSPAIVRRGLHRILGAFAELRYDVQWDVISAGEVGANHRRDRFWLLANANSPRFGKQRWPIATGTQYDTVERGSQHTTDAHRLGFLPSQTGPERPIQYSAHGNGPYTTDANRLREQQPEGSFADFRRRTTDASGRDTESRFRRIHDELAHWLDDTVSGNWWRPDERQIPRLTREKKDRVRRLKALGNGQVALCAATAFQTLYERINNAKTQK